MAWAFVLVHTTGRPNNQVERIDFDSVHQDAGGGAEIVPGHQFLALRQVQFNRTEWNAPFCQIFQYLAATAAARSWQNGNCGIFHLM